MAKTEILIMFNYIFLISVCLVYKKKSCACTQGCKYRYVYDVLLRGFNRYGKQGLYKSLNSMKGPGKL